MHTMFGNWLAGVPLTRILELIIDVSIKAVAVCMLAVFVTILLRRASAYTRNTVWVFTLVILLLLPLTHVISPVWHVPILPEVGSWGRIASQFDGMYAPGSKQTDLEDGLGSNRSSSIDGSKAASTGFTTEWHTWAIFAWAAGAFLCLFWLSVRTAAGSRILKRAQTADNSWQALSQEISVGLGLKRQVRLFESGEVRAAVTVGVINPTIVVPAGSTNWSVERRRFMLSHELAHVKRWDSLIEVMALVVKSIYWFNPMVWIAVRRLRVERERDCDDAVLNTGARPSDYALLLLDIAAELGIPPRPAWQLSTISQGSNLKDRIMCILDPKINRRRGRSRTAIVSCILLASLVFPLSTSGIWETKAQEESKKKQEELDKEKKKKMELKKKMAEKKLSAEEKVKMSWEEIKTHENSAAVAVFTALKKKGPGAGKKMYKKLKASGDDTYYFKEGEFNTAGYVFLHHKKMDEAIEVFKINVEAYPDSWNVYDSLGEAYLVAGDLDRATKYYEKSLALNPDNENGKKMLVKIAEHKKSGKPTVVGK